MAEPATAADRLVMDYEVPLLAKPTSAAAEAWTSELHPRADSGSANGGQFTSGGSGPAAAGKAGTGKAPTGATKAAKPAHRAVPAGSLGYDPASNRGTGYGRRGGDARVRSLQAVLNRLGVTDAHGKPLSVDGKLGPLTTSAVLRAQRALGVKADGIVSPDLFKLLTSTKTLPGFHPTRSAAPRPHAASTGHPGKGKATPHPSSRSATTRGKKTGATGVRTGQKVAEAIDGQRSYGDVRGLLCDAVGDWARTVGKEYVYPDVLDFTDQVVVYRLGNETWQQAYTTSGDGTAPTVALAGEPTPVMAQTWYVPVADEDADPQDPADAGADGADMAQESEQDQRVRESSRVLEAAGTDDAGGRVFAVKILAYGDSRNGRRYRPEVMREAAALYEGARAYDHHRTADELRTSTLAGLIGTYRNVEARQDGLYGNLHLLPGATHAAEALDATITAQAAGLPPLVGLSHDVLATFRPVQDGGRRLQEATKIVDVQSVDVVAHPSAGGGAVRAVAGGTDTEEPEVPPTTADVLAAFSEATDEQLAAVGLARASKAQESADPQRVVESTTDTTRTTEAAALDKTSFLGRLMVKEKLAAAGLESAAEAVTETLPDRFTEADVDAQVAAFQKVLAATERAGLRPVAGAQVTQESIDKKKTALDAFFAGDFQTGYRSFREAFLDFTGYRPRALGEDVNRTILRESFGGGQFDSTMRTTESLSSSSWNLVLGDSVTRRLVAEYNTPALMDWQRLVSSMPPVNDFRTQRIERVGGYGVLPTVNQGAPYNPLTSPGNEEVTYALAKKGGTEDVTLEMIANDDVRAISRIPSRLALAAKRTIFDFVFEFVRPGGAVGPLGTSSNPTIYDATALYAAGHNNTAATALSQTNLSAARAAMRKQAGYGDTANILSVTPRLLVVPPTLEELAFQLCTSAVAIPATPAGPSNTPNIHNSLDYVVVDYWDALSATGWIVVGDPASVPTIEVGFYQGQRDPQLFTQSDQTVGSMFNADKFTWKIRHIYSGAVLDYRGFQRGNS